MASGLIALLDDVATIARLAASSMHDLGGAAGKAGAKAAGVVIDDTAVTPRYVTGLTPDRELPIIGKITLGSLRNKLLIILPAALALAAFAPFLTTPILMIGGTYLAFEGTEKVLEKLTGDHHDETALAEADTAEELEARQVAGAIRTDFILSAEIMAIALGTLDGMALPLQAAALVAVAIVITLGVYGTVALIVKLDDIGLHLSRKRGGSMIGRLLVDGVPYLLSGLSGIGTAAMLWVGGGILVHGLDELGLTHIPDLVHDLTAGAGSLAGPARPIGEWIAGAIAAGIAGLLVGGLLVGLVHLAKRVRPATV